MVQRPSGWGMSAGGGGPTLPEFTQVGTEETKSSTSGNEHNFIAFNRTIPADTEYLLLAVVVTFSNSSTGISIASATVGAADCAIRVQFVENDSDFIGVALIDVAAPPSGVQTITINYNELNGRRSSVTVWAGANYASAGNGVLAVPTTAASEVSVEITPASSPSRVFGVAAQHYDEGLPITPLSGVTMLDEYEVPSGSVGHTAFVGWMEAPDATPLDFGATFASAIRKGAAAAVEVASA